MGTCRRQSGVVGLKPQARREHGSPDMTCWRQGRGWSPRTPYLELAGLGYGTGPTEGSLGTRPVGVAFGAESTGTWGAPCQRDPLLGCLVDLPHCHLQVLQVEERQSTDKPGEKHTEELLRTGEASRRQREGDNPIKLAQVNIYQGLRTSAGSLLTGMIILSGFCVCLNERPKCRWGLSSAVRTFFQCFFFSFIFQKYQPVKGLSFSSSQNN